MTYKKVLLIDDNEVDNYISGSILKNVGFAATMLSFSSAAEALSHLEGCTDAPSEIPDFIFLDIKMPLMDGFGFLAEFAKFPAKFRSGIRIIMLSSSIDPMDHNRSLNDPAVFSFLQKPLNKEELKKILNEESVV